MPFSEPKLREITVAQRVLTSAGYAVYEPNENDMAIALNHLVTARIFPESKVQGILPALRQSEKVMFEELRRAFEENFDQLTDIQEDSPK